MWMPGAAGQRTGMVPMKLLNRLYLPVLVVLAVGMGFTSYTTRYVQAESTAVVEESEPAINARLQELDQQIEKNHENDSSATANALRATAETERKLWQAEVDRMLDILKERLSDEEWQRLIADQNRWLVEREEQAAAASARSGSTALEELEHQRSLADSTRERAYRLAEDYSPWLSEDEAAEP